MKKEASYYQKIGNNKVQCLLCPQNCIIGEEKIGLCRVRKNVKGSLIAENYGMVSAKHLDPIEKKPLYHFHPGRNILSIGTVGCNMHCLFCQNSDISQVGASDANFLKYYSPEKIVKEALSIEGNIGIAYTYNEPGIWFEYIMDVAKLAREKGLKNVMITNGYMNEIPQREVIEIMDAFNIDLKSFSNEFYETQTFSSLGPVKDSITEIGISGKHLEITNLVIPLLNDDPDLFEEMVQWIAYETGKNTVLHISRYFPRFKKALPVTPETILEQFYYIAKKHLNYVFVGNMDNSSVGRNTHCHNCKHTAIKRSGYNTELINLDAEGKCKQCGTQVVSMG